MNEIYFENLSEKNWEKCASLELHEDEVSFIPSNLKSIAMGQFYPKSRQVAIKNENDGLVGYGVYGIEKPTGNFKIFRIMIDKNFRKRGYGKAATFKMVDELFKNKECDEIHLCYNPENKLAKNIYKKMGFVEIETLAIKNSTFKKIHARLNKSDYVNFLKITLSLDK